MYGLYGQEKEIYCNCLVCVCCALTTELIYHKIYFSVYVGWAMSTESASDDVCSETLRRMITSVSGGKGGSSSEVSAHAIRMQPDFCEHTDGLHSTVQAYYACVELIRPRLSKL